MVAGGMHGFGGMVAGGHGCWGACVFVEGAVTTGGCGCRWVCMGYDEIRSMSGRYASYWNAFLFFIFYFL